MFSAVRRSARNRKGRYENMSWLADNQMPKVGYPNLDIAGYSEEDSRDVEVSVVFMFSASVFFL